jgi:hypothetical protein
MDKRYVVSSILLVFMCFVGLGCGGAGGSRGTGGTPRTSQTVGTGKGAESSGDEETLPADVVASFEGGDITEAQLDHWMATEARTSYEDIPKGPVPSGVVPDPPEFRACIAYLRSGVPGQTSTRRRTNAELLAECRARYRALRERVLTILISFKWLEGEAKALGMNVSQNMIVQEFARFRRGVFGSTTKYQVFLRRSGQTLADEYQRMRMDIDTRGLTKHFIGKGAAAVRQYTQEFPKEWAKVTTCRSTDVIPNCKEYKGSIAPEALL